MKTIYIHADTTRFQEDRATGAKPRVIRLAWLLHDPEAEPVPHYSPGIAALCRLPAGETFDPKTAAFHGIPKAMVEHAPETLAEVLERFDLDCQKAGRVASFNAEFHVRNIVRSFTSDLPAVTSALPLNTTCLMKAATPVCKIPLMRSGNPYKSPSMVEAWRIIVHGHTTEGRAPWTADGLDPIEAGIAIVTALRDIDLKINPPPKKAAQAA